MITRTAAHARHLTEEARSSEDVAQVARLLADEADRLIAALADNRGGRDYLREAAARLRDDADEYARDAAYRREAASGIWAELADKAAKAGSR